MHTQTPHHPLKYTYTHTPRNKQASNTHISLTLAHTTHTHPHSHTTHNSYPHAHKHTHRTHSRSFNTHTQAVTGAKLQPSLSPKIPHHDGRTHRHTHRTHSRIHIHVHTQHTDMHTHTHSHTLTTHRLSQERNYNLRSLRKYLSMTDAPVVCVHPSSEVAVVSDSLTEMLYYKRGQTFTQIGTHSLLHSLYEPIMRLHARTHAHKHKHADAHTHTYTPLTRSRTDSPNTTHTHTHSQHTGSPRSETTISAPSGNTSA